MPIAEIILEEDNNEQELKVTFYPELFLQRRIWVLNILRKENIVRVLDVGCGEGELLTVLSQPAPWLAAPPSTILPPSSPNAVDFPTPLSPTYNDDIPNLHPTHVYGLDISPDDLAFAIDKTAPPKPEPEINQISPGCRTYTSGVVRWEDLEVKLWKGGLEVINKSFVDIECIVSMEVIEHLPPNVFPAFSAMLLGVYHPQYLLITTPSYTFNARFTAPDASASVRRGYPDPTKRTDRIFRHSDHKFEWTREEFETWCQEAAKEWGYTVRTSSVGRALETDPFGRDDELGGATSVAEFIRLDTVSNEERGRRGKEIIQTLALGGPSHELEATHEHAAHPSARQPKSLKEVADLVKARMESYREAFMRVEELWFEKDIAVTCGGWIEFLVRAIEESPELDLKREEEGVERRRSMWTVEVVGGTGSRDLWMEEGDKSIDYIPPDWTPGEGPHESTDDSDFGESTGAEGDVSWNGSDDDDESIHASTSTQKRWSARDWAQNTGDTDTGGWGASEAGAWQPGESSDDSAKKRVPAGKKLRHRASSSTAGWDGDEDDSDELTS